MAWLASLLISVMPVPYLPFYPQLLLWPYIQQLVVKCYLFDRSHSLKKKKTMHTFGHP